MDTEPRLACDAMLGGLARWLRAAGYDATWQANIDDWDLIRLARQEQRLLLSSDSGIFRIGIVRDGDVPALFIPPGLELHRQVAYVFQKLQLPLRPPRCMACGGQLQGVPKEQVRDRVPARTWEWLTQFWRCERCERLYWEGTHWQRIQAGLQRAVQDR